MVNMYNNKDLKMARWKWATSSDGNCIFIPKDTPYQVRHYGTSSSINFKWSKFDATIKDFPVDECDNAPTSAGKRWKGDLLGGHFYFIFRQFERGLEV